MKMFAPPAGEELIFQKSLPISYLLYKKNTWIGFCHLDIAVHVWFGAFLKCRLRLSLCQSSLVVLIAFKMRYNWGKCLCCFGLWHLLSCVRGAMQPCDVIYVYFLIGCIKRGNSNRRAQTHKHARTHACAHTPTHPPTHPSACEHPAA